MDDTPSIEDAHLELLISESHVSASEKSWLRWVKRVEAALGHDLDGNDSCEARAAGMADGYSLDGAHDAWAAGVPAWIYAVDVQAEKKFRAIQAYGCDQGYRL